MATIQIYVVESINIKTKKNTHYYYTKLSSAKIKGECLLHLYSDIIIIIYPVEVIAE